MYLIVWVCEACRMRLCIFGIEDLDSLESAVLSSFGAVPSSPTSQLDFAMHGMPLKEEELPRLVRARPIRDGHTLWMSWQLPPQLRHYQRSWSKGGGAKDCKPAIQSITGDIAKYCGFEKCWTDVDGSHIFCESKASRKAILAAS